jgi:hypothetical protein
MESARVVFLKVLFAIRLSLFAGRVKCEASEEQMPEFIETCLSSFVAKSELRKAKSEDFPKDEYYDREQHFRSTGKRASRQN